MPYFSVVIPTYNRSKLVSRAIDSVLAQTFTDFELIVVDDGSTDDTKEALKKYEGDSRFRYVYQENAKESAARNNGSSLATGDYVCFLDSDDVYYPHHLATMKRVVEENNHAKAFYHSFCEIQNEQGEVRKKQEEYFPSDNPIYKIYLNKALPNNVCLPREIAQKFKFREDIYIDEDAELFYRIASEYPVITIPEYTVLYYEHGNNTKDHVKTSGFYHNRIIGLQVYLDSPKVKEAFPKGFFEEKMSRALRWYAGALLREGKSREARKAMFQASALENKSKWNKENVLFAIKSMLKS